MPDDVVVIGFDDAEFARYTDPPLTTVRQPIIEIGREMVRLLLRCEDALRHPVRLDADDWLTLADIAARTGVSRELVRLRYIGNTDRVTSHRT